jgi:hypothetical protein
MKIPVLEALKGEVDLPTQIVPVRQEQAMAHGRPQTYHSWFLSHRK